MNKEYESVQKKLDKLFSETSEVITNKRSQEMKEDEEYKSAMKKIGKLLMKLEKLEEEDRRDKKRKGKIYT